MKVKDKKEEKNFQSASVHVLKNLGGALGGYVLGSAVGKLPSVILGIGSSAVGFWYDKDWLMSAGLGMVTSPTESVFKANVETNGIDGFSDELSNAKSRVKNALKMLGKKIYLDKISPEMDENLTLEGAEDSSMIMMGSENFDTSEVDEIIRQLEQGNSQQVIESTRSFNGHEGIGNADITELDGLDAVSLAATAFG